MQTLIQIPWINSLFLCLEIFAEIHKFVKLTTFDTQRFVIPTKFMKKKKKQKGKTIGMEE